MSQYATLAQFRVFGLPSRATTGLADDDIVEQLEAASAVVDGTIASRGYSVPLTTWSDDLSMAVCKLAAFEVLFHLRGANPADPAHAAIVLSRDWAERHIDKVAAGMKSLAGAEPTRARTGTIAIVSLESSEDDGGRGW